MRKLIKSGNIMPKISGFIIIILFSFSLTGCSHYLYTESVLSMHDSIKAPQVLKTKSYRAIKDRVETVAIIAPDSCRKQSALSASTQQRDFIRSSCGVEIGIIEKKLLSSGFNVISWEMLESMSREKSFFTSGKELGIDVLFSINSLENITADSANINLMRKYYKSDNEGIKGEPWSLGEVHKKIVRKELKGYEGAISELSFGAAIDVTAIEVKTGQAIWYYQASFYDVEKQEIKFTAAFSGKKNRWKLFQINGEPIRHLDLNSEEGSIEQERKEANLRDDVFIKYLKIAVTAFITSFKTGM